MVIRCLSAAAAVLAAACATAADYYVDPAGDDTHDGRSAGSAWSSVAKVDATAFAPGDAIHFKRGGAWRGSLVASSSGTTGSPVTYDAYGSGAKPTFLGSEALDPRAFTADGDDTYACPIARPVGSVLVDHAFLVGANGQPVENVANAWSWADGTLKIHVPGRDPRSDGRVYTACVREDAIASNGKDHLVFRDLVADETAKADGGYGVRVMGSRDVLLERVEAYRCAKHHFGCINSTQVVHRDCLAAWTMPGQGALNASAYVSFGDGSTGLAGQTSEYHGCVYDHTEETASPGDHYQVFVTHGSNIASVLLDRMVSHGGGWEVANGDNGADVRISGGLLENARLTIFGSGIVVDGLHLTGANATIDVNGSNHVLQNLVMTGTNLNNWYSTAILSRGPGAIIRFCTVVLDPTAPAGDSCIATADQSSGLRCYGNILWAPGRVLKQWVGALDATAYAEWHTNLYRSGAVFGSDAIAWSLAQWQAQGFDADSHEVAAAGFVDAASDWHLADGSPAIDAGGALDHALTTLVPLDADGTARLKGAAFDLGAYERGSGATTGGTTTGGTTTGGTTTGSTSTGGTTTGSTGSSGSGSGGHGCGHGAALAALGLAIGIAGRIDAARR